MNKRDTIQVVFRVIAIFILFGMISSISLVITQWTSPSYNELFRTTFASKFLSTLFIIGIPVGISWLLWNRSGWIADKVLAPFGMDQLWDYEVQISNENIDEDPLSEENQLPQEILHSSEESTMTHLSRIEIESLSFTVIAVWVLSSSLPDAAKSILDFFSTPSIGDSARYDYIRLISPIFRTGIAVFLLFSSNNLVAWLKRWREYRMQD